MSEQAGNAPCNQCGHVVGPHVMAAPGSPFQGGVMLCQHDDCPCFGTWNVEGAEPPEAHCGFCGSDEHRPYRCPQIKSRAEFEAWRDEP